MAALPPPQVSGEADRDVHKAGDPPPSPPSSNRLCLQFVLEISQTSQTSFNREMFSLHATYTLHLLSNSYQQGGILKGIPQKETEHIYSGV